jgi:hypothetical protein
MSVSSKTGQPQPCGAGHNHFDSSAFITKGIAHKHRMVFFGKPAQQLSIGQPMPKRHN